MIEWLFKITMLCMAMGAIALIIALLLMVLLE